MSRLIVHRNVSANGRTKDAAPRMSGQGQETCSIVRDSLTMLKGRRVAREEMSMLGTQKWFATTRPAIACAQCGKMVRQPEWSEYCGEREVRHLWNCTACGYTFETHVRLAAPQAA
jgi:hypothetical protein